jgi:iron complex transport system substrate-binding protein
MRIVSLVPSATEMLFGLGLGGSVVGVTHECDFPPEAAELPQLTATVLPAELDAGEIDAAVKGVIGEGRALYTLDEELLGELTPDLIVTQAVCEVCAVSYDDVVEVATRLPSQPRVLQQDPSTLGEVLEDVTRLGEAAGIARGWKSGWTQSRRQSPTGRDPASSRSSGSTRRFSAATGSRR